MFPFDQQNCELEFKMRNAIKAQVISSARKKLSFWNTQFFIFQVLIKPGSIVYKGTKSVVEFLVNNYTIVDAGGNRDTKKVVTLSHCVSEKCLRWWCTL